MSTITLKNQTKNGEFLEATFLSDKGMNMISFKKGDQEVIEQSTKDLFDERFAGLGALIGPHFHHKQAALVPQVKNEDRFPHIARVKAKGIQDPFSHGIGRYAPWKAEATNEYVKARLTGKDLWNEVALSTLEGQNFNMTFEAHLKENGLFLNLSVVSDTDSLVGIHYYYALPNGVGEVISHVKNADQGDKKLIFNLSQEADFTYHPSPNPLEGKILLKTSTYCLQTTYQSINAENCWQLYHPAGASFVCIEPISSKDPRHPNLSVSSIKIHLEILDLE